MALRRILVVLAIGAILMGLASTTFVWAAPGQSPVRQTLPTKTPVAPPTKEEKDKPTPVPTLTTPTPTPRTGVATPVGTVVAPPPQTLPAGGASFSTFSLVLIAAGIWLVYIGWSLRNRARG